MYDFIKWNSSCHRSVILFRFRFSSVAQSCLTLCNPMDCNTPGLPVYHQLLELAQTHVHPTISSCCLLLLLPSIFPSIRVFSNELVLHIRWPKYWSFSFSINPFNEHSGLVSSRMDWLDLLAGQGTLKSSPTPVKKHQFFGAQPSLWSNSHIHTWLLEKTIALTRWTFVSKVMFLAF